MKRTTIFAIVLLLTGTTVFAQKAVDMSFYTEEYNRTGATVNELRDILQAVKDENLTGIGEFYDMAIRHFITRLANYTNPRDRVGVEETSRLLIRGIAAEKHTESAPHVWFLMNFFDIANNTINDGLLMYEALVCIGQIGAKEYATQISAILQSYNDRGNADTIAKSRMARIVPALINALETLSEPVGVRPIFFVSVGWYDLEMKNIASNALQNLMDALGEIIPDIIIGIINDPFTTTSVKNTAWQELLRSRVSDTAKAKVAAVAFARSYPPTNTNIETVSRFMRMSAIDAIRQFGVADDSVYPYFERTYRESYEIANTDFEMIVLLIRTLSTIKTDEAVELLSDFLRGLHSRRRSGPWGIVERDLMHIIISAIGNTRTESRTAIQLLTVISRASIYTGAEQQWARDALSALSR